MNRTYILDAGATLFHADCRDALRALPDNCIDSGVMDPPYALVSIVKRFGSPNAAPAKDYTQTGHPSATGAYMRASAGFMGKQWDTGECAMDSGFWAEVLRVLKPGAHLVAFGASRGYHRMACAIEDAGFEIRDSLMWMYGTGFPKSHDVSKGIDKALGVAGEKGEVRGSSGSIRNSMAGDFAGGEYHAYIPGSEQAAEWEGWGTALKPAFEPIVLARKPLSEGTVAANVLRWRTGALNIDACRIGTERRVNAPAGNANNPDTALGPGQRGGFGMGAHIAPREVEGRWPANVCHDGSDEVVAGFPNNAARFFYSAKASKADRAGSKHPTVKPVSLMEWLCTLVTPPGGTVLDPFAGSGTTGVAARAKGFNAVLCERESEYVADILRRFDHIESPSIVPADDTHTHTHTGRRIGPIGLKR